MRKEIKKGQELFLAETREEYRQEFSALPEEYRREYEVTLTDYANYRRPDDIALLTGMVAEYGKLRGESSGNLEVEEKIAYAAFYTLNIIFRTSLDNYKLNSLMDENRSWCRSHPTFAHLNTLRYIQLGSNDDAEPETLIEQEYAFALEHHDNAGYCHAFCDLYATYCERDETLLPLLGKTWKQRALKEVEHAIECDRSYAKYYCTKGRILALDGRYEEADEMIRQSILLEDSSRTDYAIRVNSYQLYRIRIQAKCQVEEAKSQIGADKIREEIEALKGTVVSNVEIIAFFAGVISFIIGSLSLAQGQTATDAALMIVVLMGCLVAAFSAFGAILHLHDKSTLKWPYFAIAGLGLSVTLLATILTYIL